MTKYQVPSSYNYCGGTNNIKPVDHINHIMSECITKCENCGKYDYWAFGFFESSQEVAGKSKTYEEDQQE